MRTALEINHFNLQYKTFVLLTFKYELHQLIKLIDMKY